MGDFDGIEAGGAQSPKMKGGRKRVLFAGTSAVLLGVLSVLCLVVGIAVFVVPTVWLSSGSLVMPPADYLNVTCPAVTPSTTPYTSIAMTASRQAFVDAWNAYVDTVSSRPEGVRAGCEPMRFEPTAAYRGVAVVWHGFSSCPQEMSHLGPALASKGYEAIFPLMPGHGNAIRYEEESPNFVWAFLGFGLSLLFLSILGCCCICPRPKCCMSCECCADGRACSPLNRKRTTYISLALLVIMLLISVAGIIIVVQPGAVHCFSLSFVDGVGPGCGGMSEYNDNLPSDPQPYRDAVDEMNDIAALAPGTAVVSGLSGGGGMAVYAGMATKADGTALYARQLMVAPYIDVATIGPLLGPAIALGMGPLKLDFGEDCRVARRNAGKAGYCNYRLNRIDAMRQVGGHALDNLVVPPGTSIEVVKVAGDTVVTNDDITALADKYDELGSNTSRCVLEHVDAAHSPLSIWNYVHMDVEMEWIPELVCDIVNFLADGTPMPIEASQSAEGEDVCQTDCDLGGCSFDCLTDSFVTC